MTEEEDREKRTAWIWATSVLIAGLIIAFTALGSRDDDSTAALDTGEAAADADADASAGDAGADADADADEDPAAIGTADPASPDVIPETGSDGAELACRLVPGTASTTFTPVGSLGEGIEEKGLSVAAIRPATASGNVISFEVRSASRVSCDTISGFLGHRGGLRVSGDAATVELRRYRLDLASGSVVAFPKSTGSDSIEPFTVDTASGVLTDDGTMFTLADAPVVLTSAGADALNSTLSTGIFVAGEQVGTMTISGERVQ